MEHFCFVGFNPNALVRSRADQMLERILGEVPDDAEVKAKLEWDGERYCCIIVIDCPSCAVSVKSAHRFPVIALDKTELEFERRWAKWRSSRFSPPARLNAQQLGH